jgi:hypothetical protein
MDPIIADEVKASNHLSTDSQERQFKEVTSPKNSLVFVDIEPQKNAGKPRILKPDA